MTACGEEDTGDKVPAMSSPRVAMTVTYPGYAPFALISYRDGKGRPCHGLGTLTRTGPRVLGAARETLADGLTKRGRCLRASDRDVSLHVSRGGRGMPTLVGGIVRAGVDRVVVAGQAVRPRAGGEFLVVQPPGTGTVGDEIELEYRAGHHRRLPLKLVSS